MWNNDKCWCEWKKYHICEKDYVWNPPTYSWKISKHLTSFIDDSVITCDEIIEETKTAPLIYNEIFYLPFSELPLLIAVNIYCYLIKYKSIYYHIMS